MLLASIVAGGFAGALFATAIGENTPGRPLSIRYDGYWSMTFFFLVTGSLLFVIGRKLNVTGPRARLTEDLDAKRSTLLRTIDYERSMGINTMSEQEKTAYVERTLSEQRDELFRSLRNKHDVFFIPVHWLAVPAFLGAAVCLVRAVVGLFSS